MPITFDTVYVGQSYSREALAALWGYESFHAISRGVVTRRAENKIVLFVTEEKQASAEQYVDVLQGTTLNWEGPTDHFAEDRMLAASYTGDEIHLFHRERHHSNFSYRGKLVVIKYERHDGRPSQFGFRLIQS